MDAGPRRRSGVARVLPAALHATLGSTLGTRPAWSAVGALVRAPVSRGKRRTRNDVAEKRRIRGDVYVPRSLARLAETRLQKRAHDDTRQQRLDDQRRPTLRASRGR